MEVDNKTCSENVAYVSVTLLLSKDAVSSGCIHTARVNPVQTRSCDIILFITIFYSFCSHHISSSIWNTQLSITLILGNLAHVHHLYFSHLYFLYMCWCFKIECDTVSVLATHTQWTNTFSQSSRTFTPFPPFLRELHWLFWKQTCYFMLWTLPHFPVWPWALVEILQWHFNLIEMLATAT